MGAAQTHSDASFSFFRFSSVGVYLFFEIDTRLFSVLRRSMMSSGGMSSELINTFLPSSAQYRAKLTAIEVLPTDGRAAMIWKRLPIPR